MPQFAQLPVLLWGWGLTFVVCQLMQQKLFATLCYVEPHKSYSFAVCEVQ